MFGIKKLKREHEIVSRQCDNLSKRLYDLEMKYKVHTNLSICLLCEAEPGDIVMDLRNDESYIVVKHTAYNYSPGSVNPPINALVLSSSIYPLQNNKYILYYNNWFIVVAKALHKNKQ